MHRSLQAALHLLPVLLFGITLLGVPASGAEEQTSKSVRSPSSKPKRRGRSSVSDPIVEKTNALVRKGWQQNGVAPSRDPDQQFGAQNAR